MQRWFSGKNFHEDPIGSFKLLTDRQTDKCRVKKTSLAGIINRLKQQLEITSLVESYVNLTERVHFWPADGFVVEQTRAVGMNLVASAKEFSIGNRIFVFAVADRIDFESVSKDRRVMRWLQLRFDFDSTGVRLLIEGH